FLYSFIFVAIIPISRYLVYSYHLKSVLLHALKEYVQISKKREGSIMTGLSEMVIVTDGKFNIISTNDAVEKTLKLPPESIVDHNILSVLSLKDGSGNLINSKNFLPQLIENVATIINNLYFQSKKVTVQVRPLADSKGKISQIVFIITDASFAEIERHGDLAYARQKHQFLVSDLRQALFRANLPESASKISLLEKIEEDLLLAEEIEDHPIQQSTDFYDVAYLAKQVVLQKQELAKTLGISLQFELSPDNTSEKAMLDLIDSNLPKNQLPVSDFMVIINKKWAEVVLQKMVDIAILLASEKKNLLVKVKPGLQDNKTVAINISFPYPPFSQEEELFQQYYGDLAVKTNLRLGSGLEGFIAKTAADQLNIPLKISSEKYSPLLTFSINFTRAPSQSEVGKSFTSSS
ncbi:MAG: PAS domain-containing protein, partial [Patescibacteria group bacterium]|nr:PAS domain-containing protein [Patescibacteria group bacterium]